MGTRAVPKVVVKHVVDVQYREYAIQPILQNMPYSRKEQTWILVQRAGPLV